MGKWAGRNGRANDRPALDQHHNLNQGGAGMTRTDSTKTTTESCTCSSQFLWEIDQATIVATCAFNPGHRGDHGGFDGNSEFVAWPR